MDGAIRSVGLGQGAAGFGGDARVLDLFAGCGGFSQGFGQAGGFKVVGACQWDEKHPWIARTFRENHPGTELVDADITLEETKDRICRIFDGAPCDVVIGGPPCNPYSLSGRRDPNDPRGRLYEDYHVIVRRLRPNIVVMENVKGCLSRRKSEDSPPIKRIISGLEALGYRVEPRVLNAADFGVPQSRRRVIIIGTLLDAPIRFPMPTHSEHPSLFGDTKPWVTLGDAIGDLADIPEDREWWHVFTRHGSEFLDRVRRTPVGKSATKSSPTKKGYREAFFRAYPDRPCCTIKGMNGGVPVHYARDRILTPRELARVQDIPDFFRFLGTMTAVRLMIGNAVPCGLAKAVALGVRAMLDESARRPSG